MAQHWSYADQRYEILYRLRVVAPGIRVCFRGPAAQLRPALSGHTPTLKSTDRRQSKRISLFRSMSWACRPKAFTFGAHAITAMSLAKQWRTEFCVEVQSIKDRTGVQKLTLGFRARGKHNRADEECGE